MGGNSRFDIAYFHHPWREFADAETLEAKIESTESDEVRTFRKVKL